MKGTVTKWFPKSGYGFIESGGEDYFIHYSEVPSGYYDDTGGKGFSVGMELIFTPDSGPKGKFARNISGVLSDEHSERTSKILEWWGIE